MKVTRKEPVQPEYVLELSRKELLAIGILSYDYEAGPLARWHTDRANAGGSEILKNLPEEIMRDIRTGNTGYWYHDNKVKASF